MLNAGVQAEFVRVQVKDAGGTWRDLTTYPGFNAVKNVKWSEQIDQPHATFDITLFRELYQLSLSPYMAGSALNLSFAVPGTFAALIAVNRELKIEVAIVAMDTQPSSGDWFEAFHGRIDTCDAAADQDVQITGTSMSGRLSKQYIKFERVYSYAALGGTAVALRVWEGNQIYGATDYMLPASRGDSDSGLNKFFANSNPGTSGTQEPTWPGSGTVGDGSAVWTYAGAPTSSGNPVEQIMQNLLDDNRAASDPSVTLYTPSTPGWNISQFIQQRSFTMDALATLAHQIGWDVRMKWRSAHGAFELTFYGPARTSPSVVQTFGKSDYETPTALKVDIATIRNSVRVIYGDASDLWPDGTPKRKVVEVSDATSITKFGELWMEIQEDQNSQIDSGTEATAFANAALSDCKDPTAELDIPLVRGFPWVELNDYYTFSANGLQFDSDQSLAVTQYQHSSGDNGRGIKTSLQTRGLPTIGAHNYLVKSVHPGLPPKAFPHQLVPFNGVKTPSSQFKTIVGGQQMSLTQTFDKRQLAEEYECHVYKTPGSTLDSSTLKGVTKDRLIEVSDLIPGTTYYHRVIPRFRNAERLVRGQPSAETSFIAGRASAGHIYDGIMLGSYPLNGGFETRFDTSDLPDWWTAVLGTFGTHYNIVEDGNGISGNRYMKFTRQATSGRIKSATWPMANDFIVANRVSQQYRISAWLKNDAGNPSGGSLSFWGQGLDYTGSAAGGTLGVLTLASDSNVGKWQRLESYFTIPTASVRIAQLFIDCNTGGSGSIYYVDEIRIEPVGSPWYVVGGGGHTETYDAVPGFANGWLDVSGSDPDCTRPKPAFRRELLGGRELRGRAGGGAGLVGDVPIFTLPTLERPPTTLSFVVPTDQGPGLLEVQDCGDVCLRQGGNGFVDLDGVRWRTF